MKSWIVSLSLAAGLMASITDHRALAQVQKPVEESKAQAQSVADLDLEELAKLEVRVTSASKKEERLSTAPAAIFVLTSEDIRRGGFSSLPEALRMVPGLYVVKGSSHTWTVATRGFADFNNSRLLVLVDGRNVVSKRGGQMRWDVLDLPLEDIERIEVIRGPGGTLWGANACNGVINIITKKSKQTAGFSINTSAGVDEGETASVRYGGQIGERVSYRIFGKSAYSLPFVTSRVNGENVQPGHITEPSTAPGLDLYDHWSLTQTGMRIDWDATDKDTLSIEGGGYEGRIRDIYNRVFLPTPPYREKLATSYLTKGGNVVGRWGHKFSEGSSTDVVGYCMWSARSDPSLGEDYDTCGIEMQHSLVFTRRHSMIWGGNFETTGDTMGAYSFSPFYLSYVPPQRRIYLFSAFAQYEVAVVPDRLRLIAGSKIEHNSFTGFEYQPQVRAVWTPNKVHTVWVAVSRALRAQTRDQANFVTRLAILPGPGPKILTLYGNPNQEEESLRAYELGYRYQPRQAVSLDAAVYYNDYPNVAAFGKPGPAPPFVNPEPYYIVVPTTFLNNGRAQTHGGEVSANWSPIRRWKLSTAITEFRGTSVAATNLPQHMFNIQSRLDLPFHLDFDSGLYHYNAVQAMHTPTSNRVDLGLSWRGLGGLTLALWGRNLQSSQHPEYINPYMQSGDVRRAVAFQLTWQSNAEKAGSQK